MRGQALHHGALLVDPAVLRRGHDHGILAAHLIRRKRNVEAVARLADQIEIRHRRLDHDHVRAFFQIELDFAHGFAPVGRVHLIAAAVAELRRRIRRLAERPVEHRRELGRSRPGSAYS